MDDELKRIVHELRNTLSIVEGAARNDRQDQILAALGRMRTIVDQLCAIDQPIASNGVQAIMAETLVAHLRDEMAPELERLHAVDVRVSCDGSPHCLAVASLPACRLIADNLIGNAVQAGARQVYIVVAERAYGLDLIFRDNGRGMTEDQVRELGFGYSSKGANGHGQGFRIVRKLAADIGGVVAMPKSIPGLGTEVVVTLMKVGHALRAVTP